MLIMSVMLRQGVSMWRKGTRKGSSDWRLLFSQVNKKSPYRRSQNEQQADT